MSMGVANDADTGVLILTWLLDNYMPYFNQIGPLINFWLPKHVLVGVVMKILYSLLHPHVCGVHVNREVLIQFMTRASHFNRILIGTSRLVSLSNEVEYNLIENLKQTHTPTREWYTLAHIWRTHAFALLYQSD